MFHQPVHPATDLAQLHAMAFGDLIDAARWLVDRDPPLAKSYLDRLAALLDGKHVTTAPLVAATPSHDIPPAKGGLTPWQLSRVRSHIDKHLDATLHVENLAVVARLSTGHFCRAFRTTVGEPPHAFIVRQRIRRAQQLMLDTGETLSQIACACGLTDQAHLTRLFRRLVGETPMAWRRTWRRLD